MSAEETDRLAGATTGANLVHRSEWRWVGWSTLFILALTTVPYVCGWRVAHETGLVFGGFVIGVDDGNSYLAKMAQGARGDWLFHIVYTSESHRGALFFPFHLLLGKVAAVLPGNGSDLAVRLIWAYHLARLFCAAALLATVYRFLAHFLRRPKSRRLAWLMVACGGGLGWLLVAVGHGNWLGSPPLDFILPEGFTFLTIYSLPHIALARALMLSGFLSWMEAIGIGKKTLTHSAGRAQALLAGGSWLAMGLIVPFYLVVVGAVVIVTLLALLVARRLRSRSRSIGFRSREWVLSALAGLTACPPVLYSGWVFLTNPVIKGWSAQNLILSPAAPHYVAAYLVPGLFAIAGLVRLYRERAGEHWWMLAAWLLVIPPLLYAPFNLQRRLLEGYQLPLYTLAVYGGDRLLFHPRRGSWSRSAMLTIMLPTSLMLVAGGVLAVKDARPPIFHTRPEVEMASWLSHHSPVGALVLSSYQTGNFLPGWAPVRSYWGHGPETIRFAEKEAAVHRFFAALTDEEWRQAFLRDNGICYVVFGPHEQAMGGLWDWDPSYLRPVFEQNGWTLYQVSQANG